MKIFGKSEEKPEESFGAVVDMSDVVFHPQTLISRDVALIAKLNRLAPFFAMMRDKGMSLVQISDIREALTGLQIKPSRISKYIKKHNVPVIRITITDRMPKDEG